MTTKQMLLSGLLLVVLGFALPARAFHDPSLGRWLNRDPLEERDGPNMYLFVRNNPNSLIDPGGRALWGPPFLPPPSPRTEGVAECAMRVEAEVRNQRPFGTQDPSSRWNHCVASCRISRECPGGRFTAWIAGDWYQDPWFRGPDENSDPGDRAANKAGRDACKKKKSCEESCTDAFNNGSLYPPPLPPSPPEPPVFPIF